MTTHDLKVKPGGQGDGDEKAPMVSHPMPGCGLVLLDPVIWNVALAL